MHSVMSDTTQLQCPAHLHLPPLVISRILGIVPQICDDLATVNKNICAIHASSKQFASMVDVLDVRITTPYTNVDATTPQDRLRWKNFKAWMQKHGHKLHNLSFKGDVFTSHDIMSIISSSQKLARLNLDVTMAGPIGYPAHLLFVSQVPRSVKEFRATHTILCGTLSTGVRSLTLGQGSVVQLSALPFPQSLKKMVLERDSVLPINMDLPPSLNSLIINTKISIGTWNSIPRSLKKLVLGTCRIDGMVWNDGALSLPEGLKELVFGSSCVALAPRVVVMPQSLEVFVDRRATHTFMHNLPATNMRTIRTTHHLHCDNMVFPKLERLYVGTFDLYTVYGDILPSLTHLQTTGVLSHTRLPPSLRHWSMKGDKSPHFAKSMFAFNAKLETVCMDAAYNLGDQVQDIPPPFDWTSLPYAWWDRMRTLAVHTHKLDKMFPHGSTVESSSLGEYEYSGKMTLVLVRSNPVPTYTFNERDAIMRLKSISNFIAQIDVYSETTPFDSERGFFGSKLALRMELRRLCPWARIRFVKGSSEPVWDFESVVE
jgi:hypothetical protein